MTHSHLRLKLTICAVIFTQLACGAMSAQLPAYATQTATDVIITSDVQNMSSMATKTPQIIIIVGDDTTWNIREGAGLEYPVVGIAHGGDEYVLVTVNGGWVKVESGWICGQAFGGSERCE